jgi:hypothetical protein
MTSNIGGQNAGIINNVAGDQHITGRQYGTLVTTEDARRALGDLRGAVTTAGLARDTAADAYAHVAEMDATLQTGQPDKPRFARVLERLTQLLAAAGSLASGGRSAPRLVARPGRLAGGSGRPHPRPAPRARLTGDGRGLPVAECARALGAPRWLRLAGRCAVRAETGLCCPRAVPRWLARG